MKRKSQLLALLMALCLAVSALAVPAWADDEVTPENPGQTTPENPGQTTPENPGQTTPENPGQTTPENPGQTTPENPGQTTPENPGQTTPENPGQTTPENPGQTTPENPGQTTPENPNPNKPGSETPTPKPDTPTVTPPTVTKPTVNIKVSPSSIDFGKVSKDSSRVSESFTITNRSDYPTSISVSGSLKKADYSVTSKLLSSKDSTCTVTVTVNSTSTTGDIGGKLTITASVDGADEEKETTVKVSGEVVSSNYSITADPTTKDMGKLSEGYSEKDAGDKGITVTLKNNGGSSVRLNGVKGDDHFTVTASDSKLVTLESGKSVEFKVVPRKSLAVGTYTDTITFQTNEGATATFKPTIVIEKAVAALTVDPATLDFGAVEEGYAQVAEKTVTIKNNTDGALRLVQPTSYSYEFSQMGTTTLSAGSTVTLTIRPRTGMPQGNYKGEITIAANSGESAKLNVLFSVNRKAGPSTFTDVPADHTFASDIAYVSQQGLMSGKTDGNFKPGDPITRGQLVTILYRLEGQPAVSGTGFTDVKAGSYCENAVKWAAASGVTAGNNEGLFQPDEPITRQQLATFLYRYNNYKGYQVSKRADLGTFPDGESVSAYAKDALSWANGMGLVNGTGEGKLNPAGGASRGQAAAILHRFCVSIGR